jgi:hypothetical protein
MTSAKHQKLIRYVERARKKVVNARQRQRLLALIGEENKTELKKAAGEDSDSDIEDMSEDSGKEGNKSDQEMSEDSDQSESESSDEDVDGHDALQTNEFDIPLVSGIPVFS